MLFLSKTRYEIGVDEVGRGCFAGPVVAAAVLWNISQTEDSKEIKDIKDSKKLSKKNRDSLSKFIKENAIAYGICFINSERVDEVNILNATHEAMHGAIQNCISNIPENVKVEQLMIDGNNFKPFEEMKHECILQGDSKHLHIASASILAKVARDTYMETLSSEFNERYDWNNNK